MEGITKTIVWDSNSEPPKNYIWVKDNITYEYNPTTRKWKESDVCCSNNGVDPHSKYFDLLVEIKNADAEIPDAWASSIYTENDKKPKELLNNNDFESWEKEPIIALYKEPVPSNKSVVCLVNIYDGSVPQIVTNSSNYSQFVQFNGTTYYWYPEPLV